MVLRGHRAGHPNGAKKGGEGWSATGPYSQEADGGGGVMAGGGAARRGRLLLLGAGPLGRIVLPGLLPQIGPLRVQVAPALEHLRESRSFHSGLARVVKPHIRDDPDAAVLLRQHDAAIRDGILPLDRWPTGVHLAAVPHVLVLDADRRLATGQRAAAVDVLAASDVSIPSRHAFGRVWGGRLRSLAVLVRGPDVILRPVQRLLAELDPDRGRHGPGRILLCACAQVHPSIRLAVEGVPAAKLLPVPDDADGLPRPGLRPPHLKEDSNVRHPPRRGRRPSS
mmetsp:Transcript_8973/g.23170  ORF Transcript_8973/g.23170 Transcript_8973/m.23170 type:complete len:281 (+) Transcript_8973:70-912(+)